MAGRRAVREVLGPDVPPHARRDAPPRVEELRVDQGKTRAERPREVVGHRRVGRDDPPAARGKPRRRVRAHHVTGRRFGGKLRRDERAGTGPRLEVAFREQLSVGVQNRIARHAQLAGQLTRRGHAAAKGELTRQHGRPKGGRDLPSDGRIAARREREWRTHRFHARCSRSRQHDSGQSGMLRASTKTPLREIVTGYGTRGKSLAREARVPPSPISMDPLGSSTRGHSRPGSGRCRMLRRGRGTSTGVPGGRRAVTRRARPGHARVPVVDEV